MQVRIRPSYHPVLVIDRDLDALSLLLDAVDIAVPAQPSLLYYLSRDPIPEQYHSYTVPFPVPPTQPAAPLAQPPQAPMPPHHRQRNSSHTNGNGTSNGAHRSVGRSVRVHVGSAR